MIADLKPYPATKDSGVPWLREVPEHWEVGTLRRKLRPYDGIKIGPFGSQLKLDQMSDSGYKVYGQANVIARDFSRGTKFVDHTKFNELAACEVQRGDLLVTMMGTSGRCARVPDSAVPGIMDSHLLRLRTTADIDARFAAKIIDEAPYVKEQITVAGKGSIMHGLNSSMIKNLVLAFPPFPEQAAIVRFIHHVDRGIRRYIRAKQKLIKLLEEQKQAIIHRAVTRGLDSNVRLKPSGVEWLGDVPKHWEMKRCRYLFREIDQRSVDGSEEHLSMSQRLGLVPSDLVENRTLTSESYAGGKLCAIGDLVLNRLKAHLGVFALARYAGVISPDYTVLRPIESDGTEYFERVLRSPACRRELRIRAKGIVEGFWRLYTDDFYDIYLPVPPVEDRLAIIEYIRSATAEIDKGVSGAQRGISLLHEYRNRLIADVVTGKLDVREAAAHLPDEVGESEPLDDAEVEGDAEADAPDEVEAVSEEVEA